MNIETVLIIIGLCLAACYVVFEYQKSATPPYQEPVAPDLTEQWVKATKADTLDNIDKWNAKVGDKIWYKPDDGALAPAQIAQIKETAESAIAAWPFPQGPKLYVEPVPQEELDPTPLNPQAAWPFPQGPKP